MHQPPADRRLNRSALDKPPRKGTLSDVACVCGSVRTRGKEDVLMATRSWGLFSVALLVAGLLGWGSNASAG